MHLATALTGVIVGGLITFAIQRAESRRLGRLDRTHRLYESWQSVENFPHRVRANDILRRNAESASPKSYLELRRHLNPSGDVGEWLAITRIVHFFEEVGALLDTKAIDGKLTKSLFDRYIIYWVDQCLGPLYRASIGKDESIELNWFRRVELLRSAMDD